ncbi:DNA-binding response regulator [Terasakiispira papahanaumokuakeensis]|uniref:DNA-binding response regulator n=1 Tax=Terasakiispira papahanaumokuakeensis TaxID=197479 RepID=A0A1E2VC13_9GAMM|nr:response regulator transcription factor [Terasakiispira papahanaumokuakeensis]ODC04356.1 DNA-binding response regulator [Terasakiispira papahanaumokuakeensis]
MKLLLVEDDDNLVEQLRPRLQQAGFAVEVANDGIDGAFLGMEETLDGVILDLGLPGQSGLEVLKEWRSAGRDMPVLILTARDAWHEKVDGLKAGADDYLGKPFHVEELVARLEAIIRRHHGQADPMLKVGKIHLNQDTQCVTDASGHTHELTAIEFRLLRCLMLNVGQIMSKTALSEHVYEEDQLRDSNVMEVYVNRLRQRLGRDVIKTRRGQGYVMPTPEGEG